MAQTEEAKSEKGRDRVLALEKRLADVEAQLAMLTAAVSTSRWVTPLVTRKTIVSEAQTLEIQRKDGVAV